MLKLVARRTRAQWPLLAALLAIVTVGATLLGACVLLMTRTADQALQVAASRVTPEQAAVTAYTVTVAGRDARSVAADTRAVLSSALAPFAATTATRASAVLRRLPAGSAGHGASAKTYLSGVEGLQARAQLIAGRWPRPAAAAHPAGLETVLLEPTARLLGLAPGSRVRLDTEILGTELDAEPGPPVELTVVGVVRPLPATGWDRDPLAAAGYDLAYQDGRSFEPIRVYGPFLVDLADLLAGDSTIQQLEITAHPDLSHPTRRDLDTVTAALLGADRRLARTLGTRVKVERVAAQLPLTLLADRDQQRVTAATVLAVAVLGSVLAGTALALAGRLTAGIRSEEGALLSALGFSRRQFAAAAALEAGALALLAAAAAVPASTALHAALTRLPPLAGAGLAVHPAVSGLQVLVIAAGALGFAAVLVIPALRPAPTTTERRSRRELLARSGADLLLVAFAAAAWWQLRTQPTAADPRTDTVRVLAPALLLIAGAALALRLVRPALGAADRLAQRGQGLILPLAASEAARRPQAVAAGLLIGLACATGTFGIAYDATWQRSQRDQADLAVGTDLTVSLSSQPAAGQGAAVAAATGGVVSPATNRGTVVGQWLGSAGDPPRLVAVDTTRAGALLRGRLDGGRSWTQLGAALAPPTPATGLPVPAGAAFVLTGTATGGGPLLVTPRLLLQDATGLRTACTGAPVPLDGSPHRLPGCATVDGLRLVALSLPIAADTAIASAPASAPQAAGSVRVRVALTVPGAAGPVPGPGWTVLSAGPANRHLSGLAVTVTGRPAGTELALSTTVQPGGPEEVAPELIATAFPLSGSVPVAISARLAGQLGAQRDSRFTITVATTPVPVTVAEVLPEIPAAPGAAAVLADLDTLSRALVAAGDLEFPADAWWVGNPVRPDAAGRAAALRIGTVTTRATESARLAAGPVRAGLPAVLRLLVPAAVLLLLAGVVLHVTCDLQLRAVEVARLRGLGMSRRDIRRVLLGQHAGILLPLLVAGAAVGALAGRIIAPLLVRSATGAAPIPAALPDWPWAVEAALLAVLLAGCALAVTAVVTVLARRADAAHLRVA